MNAKERKCFDTRSIYVGLDVHKKSWSCVILNEIGEELKRFTQTPDAKALHKTLRQHFPQASISIIYEAGFSGYWAHRAFETLGMYSVVANPADIPTTDQARKKKNDWRDAEKLAQSLRTNLVRPLYIPSQEVEEMQTFVRNRVRLQRTMTQYKNRIKHLLHKHGIPIPETFRDRGWSKAFYQWLCEVEFQTEEGKEGFAVYLRQYQFTSMNLSETDGLLRKRSKDPKWSGKLSLLMSIPGIGLHTAWVLVTELIDIDRFPHLDHLCSYAGIVPDIRSSGEKKRVGRMTHRANVWVKTVIIEAAWKSVQHGPAFQAQYKHYLAKGKIPQRAIICITRKLLAVVRSVWKNKQSYQVHLPKKDLPNEQKQLSKGNTLKRSKE